MQLGDRHARRARVEALNEAQLRRLLGLRQREAIAEHDHDREELGAQPALAVALAEDDAVGRLEETNARLDGAAHVHPDVDLAVPAHARDDGLLAEQALGQVDVVALHHR